jgi:uncharacterized protein
MKYLVLLAVILVAIWIWRNNRRVDQQDSAPAQPQVPGPQDMVRCPVCSVHLPRTDALAGPDGRLYCCQEHRLRAGS